MSVAVPLAVLGEIRVEQIDRHLVAGDAANRILPGAKVHRASFDLHGRARVDGLEHVLRPPLTGVSVWLPCLVEMLLEVAFAMEQRDADDRHGEIGRRSQRVTGEHAKAAAVGGDRLDRARSPSRSTRRWSWMEQNSLQTIAECFVPVTAARSVFMLPVRKLGHDHRQGSVRSSGRARTHCRVLPRRCP